MNTELCCFWFVFPFLVLISQLILKNLIEFCKNMYDQTSINLTWKCVFRTSFSRLPLEQDSLCSLIPLRISVDYVTLFSSSPLQQLRWSSLWQQMGNIGNSWKLLMTCCYKELCLKCVRAPRSDSKMHR